MTVNRDYKLSPVQDFLTNVKSKLKDNMVATEIVNDCGLVGWRIEPLTKK